PPRRARAGAGAAGRRVPRVPRAVRMSGFRCRAGGGTEVPLLLSRGRTPLATSLVTPGLPAPAEPTYPLELVFCEACTLVQINETVPPELMFSDYAYFSSYPDTMLAHARALVD